MKTLNVVAYKQTGRRIYGGPANMIELPEMIHPPREFQVGNTEEHGNRPIDKQHLNGIASYIEENDLIVLNSMVAYVDAAEVHFVADDGRSDAEVELALDMGMTIPGKLTFMPGRRAWVG